MSGKNKTDKLDAKGLAILLRSGTLPEVWIHGGSARSARSDANASGNLVSHHGF